MKRLRILLADDHRLLREAFAELLEPGCDVVAAVADGRALLAAARELHPDMGVTSDGCNSQSTAGKPYRSILSQNCDQRSSV